MVNNFLSTMKKYGLSPELPEIDNKPINDTRDLDAEIELFAKSLDINLGEDK